MRLLYSSPHPGGAPHFSDAADAAPPQPLDVDSDVVVILAALLCALICVVGLLVILVARCAWIRRSSTSGTSSATAAAAASSSLPPPPPNKGLKKKALRALPRDAFKPSAHAAKLVECPICLAEFAEGEEIRILPQCGHGFHVACVDTWLEAHSSCPSCRQVLMVAAPVRCQKCGASSLAAGEVGPRCDRTEM